MKTESNNKLKITKMLGITYLDYCQMVERGGYEWLERYYSHVPELIDISSRSALFWKWWVNEWNIRDECFIVAGFLAIPANDVQVTCYKRCHLINRLHIVPNRFVVNEVSKLVNQYVLNNSLKTQNLC